MAVSFPYACVEGVSKICLKFRRQGITQKKAHNIQNTGKVWNHECTLLSYLYIGVHSNNVLQQWKQPNHTGNLTTILTGHWNIKAYLNQFHISDDSTSPCGKGEQTTDHVIYDCDRPTKERDKLKAAVTKTNTWPTNKRNLINRHYSEFSKFINSISFEELNAGWS